jgi:fibro-slime domain-containing protein
LPRRSAPCNTVRVRCLDRWAVAAIVPALVAAAVVGGAACAKIQTGAPVDPGPDSGQQGDGPFVPDIASRGELGSVFSVDAWADFVGNCGQQLTAIVRDFRGFPGPNGEAKHPDFEYQVGDVKGIVAPTIGPDDKPVYAPAGATAVTNGPDAFAQWYRDVPDVNIRFETTIQLSPDPPRPGTFVFDSDAYFPIDGQGFMNQYQAHNYDFTTEVHFNFPYQGGEIFSFRGDDDLWLFVNGHLAIDLGGVHIAEKGTVNLDLQASALGITPNHVYRMDIFQAERHLSDSTFHIETTLQCIDNVVIP